MSPNWIWSGLDFFWAHLVVSRSGAGAPADLRSLMQFHAAVAPLSVGISWENGRQKREANVKEPSTSTVKIN